MDRRRRMLVCFIQPFREAGSHKARTRGRQCRARIAAWRLPAARARHDRGPDARPWLAAEGAGLHSVLGLSFLRQPRRLHSKRRHRLAGLCDRAAQHGCGPRRLPGRHGRPGVVRAALPARPARRRDGRSAQSQGHSQALLRGRGRGCGGPGAVELSASRQHGPAAGRLCRLRRLAGLYAAGQHRPWPNAGPARASAALNRLEFALRPGRRDHGTGARRRACGHLPHPGLRNGGRPLHPIDGRHLRHPQERAAGCAYGVSHHPDQGGAGLCVGVQDRLRRHLARSLRGAARRGDGAFAGLRPRRAASRTERLWPSALGPGDRCGHGRPPWPAARSAIGPA